MPQISIFYLINWIYAAETIQGRKLFLLSLASFLWKYRKGTKIPNRCAKIIHTINHKRIQNTYIFLLKVYIPWSHLHTIFVLEVGKKLDKFCMAYLGTLLPLLAYIFWHLGFYWWLVFLSCISSDLRLVKSIRSYLQLNYINSIINIIVSYRKITLKIKICQIASSQKQKRVLA